MPLAFPSKSTLPSSNSPVPAGDEPAFNTQLAGWIRAAAAGDIPSFDALYGATSGWLLYRVRRIVGSTHAEDVLTEVYLQVWRTLATFEASRGTPLAWLATIAKARALDRLRREKVINGASSSNTTVALDDKTEPMARLGCEPDQQLWQHQAHGLLQSCIATLSTKEQVVLGLAYFRECTQTEIAALTGLPLGTVKTLMSRSQEKLRLALFPDEKAFRRMGYPRAPAVAVVSERLA
jgi:RNA polymerase sigma-70 factor (ECF subfamily)